ncbi:MAG: hypothetical protein ISQ26_07495 [Candidatus Puniceispirillum sp.]|nr:hypothetical protein [Candidatus Puniceispirillum sp.]
MDFRRLFIIALLLTGLLPPQLASATIKGFAVDGDDWPGFWFICEFAQRQRAPDDECKMFDDEGFQLADGRLRYIRMHGSTETACRSNKKGQCFSSILPAIRISRTDRGKLSLGDKLFKVRYFGCSQTYYFTDTPNYREIWPDEKRCFWASKRRFYIAPYHGKVTIIE